MCVFTTKSSGRSVNIPLFKAMKSLINASLIPSGSNPLPSAINLISLSSTIAPQVQSSNWIIRHPSSYSSLITCL